MLFILCYKKAKQLYKYDLANESKAKQYFVIFHSFQIVLINVHVIYMYNEIHVFVLNQTVKNVDIHSHLFIGKAIQSDRQALRVFFVFCDILLKPKPVLVYYSPEIKL